MKVLRKYKNILVTGGDGFIGINYVKMLVSNKRKYGYNELVVVDNGSKGSNNLIWSDEFKNKIIPYNVDICDADSIDYIFKKHKIDCVVHFAAESHVDRSITDPLGFVKTNVIGTATLLNTAKNHWGLNDKTLFHHVSTDEVFGEALED
jgi:dTDP-glucose 4,6-dehydratase